MKLKEVIVEDAGNVTGSNDYEQMQAFVRANRVQGIPPEQQVALALFKELKKQKQQNAALSAELSDAEQRIDQAAQSSKLQGQELGMHRSELDREREAGKKQQAAVGQLGQQYAEREKASTEQIQGLASQLEAVKNMPGVNKDVADKLEKQIQDLGKNSISAEKVQELESSIAMIRNAETADDAAIKDLVSQVKAAQETATDLRNTKTSLTKDLESQLANLKNVEKTVSGLRRELNNLETGYEETDATVFDLENEVHRLKTQLAAKNAVANAGQMVSSNKPSTAPAPAPKPAPAAPTAANQSKYTPAQLATARKLGLSGDLTQEKPSFAVAEAAFKRSIAWATGKQT